MTHGKGRGDTENTKKEDLKSAKKVLHIIGMTLYYKKIK